MSDYNLTGNYNTLPWKSQDTLEKSRSVLEKRVKKAVRRQLRRGTVSARYGECVILFGNQTRHSSASVTAPKIIHLRNTGRPVTSVYAQRPQPANSTQTSQLLCSRRGVKPKQEM